MTRPARSYGASNAHFAPTMREIVIHTETMGLVNGHRVVEIDAVELINRSDVVVRCQSNLI
jgi:DNA polymerase III epsilon subunit-like protein